ncbi:MAG: hypothetical protein ACPL7B_05480 [Candidatus Poribacteria bacterium]
MKNFKILAGIGVLAILTILSLTFWIGCGSDDPNEPGTSYSSAPPADVFERVKAIQEKHTDKLMEKLGVIGTAIGFDRNSNPAIYVLTEKAGIPDIPKELDSVPVIVEVSGKIEALGKPVKSEIYDRTKRYRPAPIGVSTGHPAITAGTIGCRVKKGDNVYALSNNHIYANENKAKIGDNVLQPGAYDGGENPDDAIGTLSAFCPIVFKRTASNVIDAAIAISNEENLGNSTLPDSYGTPKSIPVSATIGMQVKKDGRTTALTYGQIYLINATVNVQYDRGIARFVNQIIITPGGFSAGGDSGSLIVTKDGNSPVGLLFAGSSTMTVANPIQKVLDYFGVTIDGQ